MSDLADLAASLHSQGQVEKAQSLRDYSDHFITYLEAGEEAALVEDDLERIAANPKADRVVAYGHTIQIQVLELRPNGFNDGVGISKDHGDRVEVRSLSSSETIYETLAAARLAAIKRGIHFLQH